MDVLNSMQFDPYITEACKIGGQVFAVNISGEHLSLWDLYNDLTWDVYGSLSVEEAVEKYAPQFEAAVAEAFRRFNR